MGTTDAAQAAFDSAVRLGLPVGIGGLADRVAGPSYAAVVGLVKWGARTAAPPSNGRGHNHPPALSGAYHRTMRWFRDFF
jgi:cell division ATPase FtsA